MWTLHCREHRFPSEVRWRHKLAAHDIAVHRRQAEPLPGGVSIISPPPRPRPSAMSVLSNGPVHRTSRSGDLRPPARVVGEEEGTPACRAARVACSLWRRRGREGCGEHVGDRPVRPSGVRVRPSVRTVSFLAACLARSRRVGATHFPKEHSTLWPRLHTVLMVSTFMGELHNIRLKELCTKTCHWLRDCAPSLTGKLIHLSQRASERVQGNCNNLCIQSRQHPLVTCILRIRKQSVSLSDHCDLKSRPDNVLVPTLCLSRPFMFFVHNGVRSGVFVEP